MIVLGNEGRGVSEEVLSNVDVRMKIEMPGQSESLNVAIAGGIIMHHFKA
jgi:TrmH family RNA methyltransferase